MVAPVWTGMRGLRVDQRGRRSLPDELLKRRAPRWLDEIQNVRKLHRSQNLEADDIALRVEIREKGVALDLSRRGDRLVCEINVNRLDRPVIAGTCRDFEPYWGPLFLRS